MRSNFNSEFLFETVFVWITAIFIQYDKNITIVFSKHIIHIISNEKRSLCAENVGTCVPEVGFKGRGKKLHPTDTVGCNYLSLLLIPASGTQKSPYVHTSGPHDANSFDDIQLVVLEYIRIHHSYSYMTLYHKKTNQLHYLGDKKVIRF